LARGGFQEEEGFVDTPEVEELEADFEDFTDDEDDEYRGGDVEQGIEAAGFGRARPVWVYAGGEFIWCNPRFGFNISFREGLRQLLGDSLRELRSLGRPFDTPSPFFLFGFFREEWVARGLGLRGGEDEEEGRRPVSLVTRLSRLRRVGAVIPGKGVFPLSVFQAGKGQGTGSIPPSIEGPWVRRVFSERGLGPGFTWRDAREWLPGEYERFTGNFRAVLTRLLPGIEERSLPVFLKESTLQRKKLSVFRGYLSGDDF
jgi:hypothetical protein